jgi:two-component system, chemotaxis family, sensor kinase CheA
MRDLSQKLNKEIEFVINGGDIELDRTIVDKLGEPLVHLLRNAADHGVGESGTVKLEAVRESNYVLISVENDGKNLDLHKIKSKAIEKGILSSQKADFLTDEQVMNLIFDSQLSTKDQITEVSGRGVGLGVVKSFAEMLGGRVIVENLDPGVRFTLELPLTLAIISSLLVEVNKTIFAVPFSNVERSVTVAPQDIKMMADNEVAVVDGTKVPLARLSDIFQLDKYNANKSLLMSRRKIVGKGMKKVTDIQVPVAATTAPTTDAAIEEDENQNIIVVLIRKEKELIGVVVDNLISEQEVIVKPLSPILRGVRGFSGSTILGDGRTVLILDVMNLLHDDKK